jgi:hypothetical protein
MQDKFVVHENFAIVIPDGYPLQAAGPVTHTQQCNNSVTTV